MNGVDFLEAAKQEFPQTQYIVVSGYDDFKYAQVAIKSGAIDYILKPVDEKDLNAAIERAVIALNRISVDQIEDSPAEDAEKNLSPAKSLISSKLYRKNYAEISNYRVSEKYFFSQKYLSKLFKNKYNIGIYEYALKLRMEHATIMMRNTSLQIQEISDRLGYSNNNYFSKAFKTYYGVSPSEYREQEQT